MMSLTAYALVPLATVAVVAGAAVVIVTIALRGTAPRDRAGIVHAAADLVRAVWHTKP
jgi:hypothetical protein